MEDVASEKKKESIKENEQKILYNNKDKKNILNKEITNIINNINKYFDFKTFEHEKINIIEKVIKSNIKILLINIVFNGIKIYFKRK